MNALTIITSRAVAVYSLGFKSAAARGHSFNSARAHGRKLERAFIANEIKRSCDNPDVSFYAANGIIVSD